MMGDSGAYPLLVISVVTALQWQTVTFWGPRPFVLIMGRLEYDKAL